MTIASDTAVRAAIRMFDGGAPLVEAVDYTGLGEAAFRYRYRRLTGEPLRLLRKSYPAFVVPTDRAVLAYMAGIIDGEGWVSRNGSATRNRPWTVSFASTNFDVIDYFAKFGGSVHARHDSTLRGGTIKSVKPQRAWRIGRQVDIFNFLTAIREFAIIKREKIKECLTDIGPKLAAQGKHVSFSTAEAQNFPAPILDERSGAHH